MSLTCFLYCIHTHYFLGSVPPDPVVPVHGRRAEPEVRAPPARQQEDGPQRRQQRQGSIL
jgi:hypothetical protein